MVMAMVLNLPTVLYHIHVSLAYGGGVFCENKLLFLDILFGPIKRNVKVTIFKFPDIYLNGTLAIQHLTMYMLRL